MKEAETVKKKTTKKPATKAKAKTEVEKEKKTNTMVATSRVYIRTKPALSGDVVRIVELDEKVEVINVKDSWAKVEEGFILAKFLKKK